MAPQKRVYGAFACQQMPFTPLSAMAGWGISLHGDNFCNRRACSCGLKLGLKCMQYGWNLADVPTPSVRYSQ